MHDMTAKKAAADSGRPASELFRSTTSSFRPRLGCAGARRSNVPLFAFEYGDTGAGTDVGIAHNWAAFDAIKIAPRYGVMPTLPPVEVELFGTQLLPRRSASRRWAGRRWCGRAPILLMAKAAQRARVPYTLGVAGGATIEEAAKVAPDVFWLQLYRFWQDDHEIGFDLVRRAQAADVKVLALTLDVPVRTTRSRETYAGLARRIPPQCAHDLRNDGAAEMAAGACCATAIRALPRSANMPGREPAPTRSSPLRAPRMGGAFSWEEVARYRDALERPDGGQRHPASGRRGEGGVARHRGHLGVEPRRPADRGAGALDRRAAGGRRGGRQEGDLVLDSGIRSGQDVMRALALGANAAFAGKVVSLGGRPRSGDEGPDYLIDLYIDELRASLGQIGARSLAEARLATRSPPRRSGVSEPQRAAKRAQALALRRIIARDGFITSLTCARSGDLRRRRYKGRLFPGPACRRLPSRFEHVAPRRQSGAPQRHGARGRAGARRRQQHRHRQHRQYRRRRAGAGQGPRDVCR